MKNYNEEIKDNTRKYAYGFDLDVMHPYMIKSFTPWFKQGSVLELGSYKGDFTKRLLKFFPSITCIEASADAAYESMVNLKEDVKEGAEVRTIISTFEDAKLNEKYDNIVLTHVLEHIDKPIALLKKIRNEWLADGGRLFIVVPNAYAASRQIAVNMGLMKRAYDVTDAERKQGHVVTYNEYSLEQTVEEAELITIHKSGIFFKAFANFQWDKILKTDIVTPEYLDGCYQLGLRYPELCSSVFFVCNK